MYIRYLSITQGIKSSFVFYKIQNIKDFRDIHLCKSNYVKKRFSMFNCSTGN